MVLDKTTILAAPDLKRETVNVPEWGGDVMLQEMTALDRDRLNAEVHAGSDGPDFTNFRAKVLVRCVVNEDGSRIFCDEEATALGSKSKAALDRLETIANKINKVNSDKFGDSVGAVVEMLSGLKELDKDGSGETETLIEQLQKSFLRFKELGATTEIDVKNSEPSQSDSSPSVSA